MQYINYTQYIIIMHAYLKGSTSYYVKYTTNRNKILQTVLATFLWRFALDIEIIFGRNIRFDIRILI